MLVAADRLAGWLGGWQAAHLRDQHRARLQRFTPEQRREHGAAEDPRRAGKVAHARVGAHREQHRTFEVNIGRTGHGHRPV